MIRSRRIRRSAILTDAEAASKVAPEILFKQERNRFDRIYMIHKMKDQVN